MRPRQARLGVFLSLLLAAALLPPAVAHAATVPVERGEFVVPEGSVLASPEDVARTGGTAAQVEKQRALWDSLSPEVRAQQAELHRIEDARAEGAWTNLSAPSAITERTGRSATTLVYKTSCTSGTFSQYYKVDSDTQAMRCFAGAPGYYDLSQFGYGGIGTANGTRISTGTHYCGRVQYHIWGNPIWSVARAYDPNWYSFDSVVNYDNTFGLLKLQIQDC